MSPLFQCLLAYVLLTVALQRSIWGSFEPVSLILVVLSLLTVAAGLCLPWRRRLAEAVVWLMASTVVVVELIYLRRASPEELPQALALQRQHWPSLERVSVVLIVATLLAGFAGICLGRRRLPQAAAWIVLGGFTFIELVLLYLTPSEKRPLGMCPLLVFVGAVVASYAWKSMPASRARFPLILAAYMSLGASFISEWPPPPIDVWYLQQEAAGHLLAGEDPYAASYGHPPPDPSLYGPDMIKDGKVQSFPYPPLSLLLVVPGYVAGDIRWSLLAAVAASACFMVAAGRRLGLGPGHPAEMAVAAFLFQPRGFYVLHMGWTEPLVLLAVSAAAWAMAGRRALVSGLGLAMTPIIKQYGLLCILPAWSSGRLDRRKLLVGAVVAALLTLPFLLWDPAAFWRGTVHFHTSSPFREDSLSVLAWVYLRTSKELPAVVGFAVAALATWLSVRSPVRSLARAVLGEAAVLLAFFAFNKAAHINYYWLVDALLALALLLSAAEWTAEDAPLVACPQARSVEHVPA